MTSSIRALVDQAFARDARAEPADDDKTSERAAPPASSADVEARAQKMLDLVDKSDFTPKARALIGCILEALCEATDRIAALERQPFEYTGVHVADKAYRKGQFATCDGSLWACMRDTVQRPGDGSDWQLAAKKGRDAR